MARRSTGRSSASAISVSPCRIDSGRPWPSPSRCSGRCAVQIVCPDDLCRTSDLLNRGHLPTDACSSLNTRLEVRSPNCNLLFKKSAVRALVAHLASQRPTVDNRITQNSRRVLIDLQVIKALDNRSEGVVEARSNRSGRSCNILCSFDTDQFCHR